MVTLETGKIVSLGKRISAIKDILKGTIKGNLTEEQKVYWLEKYGLKLDNKLKKERIMREKKYQEALELWLQKHLDKTVNDIPQKEVVILSSGEEVPLGKRIANIRQRFKRKGKKSLSEDQYIY